MSLAELVAAAKAAAEAKYASQTAPHDPNQQAEILIAQVQAILAGETTTNEPESAVTGPPATVEPPATETAT